MTNLKLAYYGDDFTGSTDVMEVLQWSGLRTVLFLEPPCPAQIASYPGLRALGVAGWSRTMSTEEMDADLPAIFESLKTSGAQFIHYKVCSTFDSSATIGNIGRALELGQDTLASPHVPIVVGAPNLGRYQVFGNLYARSGLETEPYRLDRHPTMSRHPITPMGESDLRAVLASQTQRKIGLIDVLRIDQGDAAEIGQQLLKSSHHGTLLDVLYPEHLPRLGAIIEEVCGRASNFVLGSSGIEYALTEHWLRSGRLDSMRTRPAGFPKFGPVKQVVGITGSCSPVNDRQILWAERNGFESMAIDTAGLVADESPERAIETIVAKAVERLDTGASLILTSSRGPGDPRVLETQAALRKRGLTDFDIKLLSGRILGPLLGRILKRLLSARPIARVGIAGGDTSGYVARCLGIEALEAIAPLAPGSPLCSAHSKNELNGIELCFKGGQVGRDDVWATLLKGTLGSGEPGRDG